jgi:hypothetical protein
VRGVDGESAQGTLERKHGRCGGGWSWQAPLHERVEAGVGLFMPCVGEVTGDPRGFESRVSQVLLDQAEVHTGYEQRGSGGMSEGMDSDAILVIPARCVALRKAPWTLFRRMGSVALDMGV